LINKDQTILVKKKKRRREMPEIELIEKNLPKRADPKQTHAYAKVQNKLGQERYFIVDKITKTPVCGTHWNNDLNTLECYISSLESHEQSKCVGCGMLEKCK
jgi:hypothetical protein